MQQSLSQLRALVEPFLASYDQARMDRVWNEQSERFRTFWQQVVLAPNDHGIADTVCDPVIRILDRKGSGNTKGSEAVASAMVAQGAWRRMFNELHGDKALGQAVNAMLTASNDADLVKNIDGVYRLNAGRKNHMTGASGNALGAMLAAWDPKKNLSMISLTHRKLLLDFVGRPIHGWEDLSAGQRFVATHKAVIVLAEELGLPPNARTLTKFLYADGVEPVWRQQLTVQVPGGTVEVVVPTATDESEESSTQATSEEELRSSMLVQALVARIGAAMGFKIWLPRSDRSRVLRAWAPAPGQLLDSLPLGFDPTTTATVEQIDVLWVDRRSIVRAFEVEHTTAIYSGLLRMADLLALQPRLDIRLHIVAGLDRREKVLREIQRPVFALLEGGSLRDKCTYLSYDSVREIAAMPFLQDTREGVLRHYEEWAAADDAAA